MKGRRKYCSIPIIYLMMMVILIEEITALTFHIIYVFLYIYIYIIVYISTLIFLFKLFSICVLNCWYPFVLFSQLT